MTDQQHAIFAAVLAAGSASRFGATKQAASLDGIPLVQRAARTAAKVLGDRVITVIGHEFSEVLQAMDSRAGFVVVNEHYQAGINSSIAVAARTARKSARAMLLLLADQPLVTAEHLQALIDKWSGADDDIVATAFDKTTGPPVLFPCGTFDTLCELRGDAGARALLRDDRFRLKTVRFEAAGVDIDTPPDLEALA